MKRIKLKKRSLWGHIRRLAIITAIYQVIFSPPVMSFIIKNIVKRNTEAILEMDIKRISLFYGFDVSDVNLYTSKNDVPIFKANRIFLSYSFFSFFIGHIGIRRLEISNPSVYLIKQDGRWNTEALFPILDEDSAKNTPDEKIPDFIHFFYPLKFYTNIFIKDLSFHYSDEADSSLKKIEINNMNFFLLFITRTITGIPVNENIFDIFDTFSAGINPIAVTDIQISGEHSVEMKPVINWYIFHDRSIKNIFLSRLLFDENKNDKISNNTNTGDTRINYDVSYNSTNDTLLLNEFNVNVLGNSWIESNGTIKNISGNNISVDIGIKNSRFYIDPSYYVFQSLTGFKNDPLTVDGKISNLQLFGSPDNLRIISSLDIHRLIYNGAGFPIYIKNFTSSFDGTVDAYTILPLQRKPDNYLRSKNLALGLFYKLDIPILSMIFNESHIGLSGSIQPERGVELDANLIDFNIAPFTAPDLTGFINGNVKLTSDELFNNLRYNMNVKLTGGRFLYGHSLSKQADYQISGIGKIRISDAVTSVTASSLSIDGKNSNGNNILSMRTQAGFQFFKAESFYNFTDLHLALFMEDLYPTLPGEMQYELKPIRKILSKGLQFDANYLSYRETANTLDFKSDLRLTIPYLRLEDIMLKADIFSGPLITKITKLDLNALKGSLLFTLSGSIVEKRDSLVPDLNFRLVMQHDLPVRVHQNLLIQGGLLAELIVNEQRAAGIIVMNDLDIKYEGGKCHNPNSPECIQFYVHKMNLNLPIYHDMKYTVKSGADQIPVSVSKPYVFQRQANLGAEYIMSNHSPRGEFFPDGYYYIGAPGSRLPGLSAHIRYINNSLEIPWLKLLMYKSIPGKISGENGQPETTIDGRDIKIGLSNLEYRI